MIVLTESEINEMAERVIIKIDKDKKFDRYTDMEIVVILGVAIMQVGAKVGIAYAEEEQEEAMEDGGMAS